MNHVAMLEQRQSGRTTPKHRVLQGALRDCATPCHYSDLLSCRETTQKKTHRRMHSRVLAITVELGSRLRSTRYKVARTQCLNVCDVPPPAICQEPRRPPKVVARKVSWSVTNAVSPKRVVKQPRRLSRSTTDWSSSLSQGSDNIFIGTVSFDVWEDSSDQGSVSSVEGISTLMLQPIKAKPPRRDTLDHFLPEVPTVVEGERIPVGAVKIWNQLASPSKMKQWRVPGYPIPCPYTHAASAVVYERSSKGWCARCKKCLRVHSWKEYKPSLFEHHYLSWTLCERLLPIK